ncbi:GL12804 [Drosophila persimilis]|uniref:GL12804 n=1 Tax=Drosophila persimilis TaxID=7234 RepID=B4H7Q2_DROPE|nr:GL12804 [Drosophila persimilis]
MITGPESRQTHRLLDLKKQQWAKEREEIARMDEMYHHQHTSHHKIERTSIRTYYSNLDLSQTSTSSQSTRQRRRLPPQQQQQQQQQQDMHLILRQAQALAPAPAPAPAPPADYRDNGGYLNQLERYIEDLDADADADFEDDEESLYRRTRRGSYAPGMASMRQMQMAPARYVEMMPPTSLQTAKGRMQHAQPQQQQQQQQGYHLQQQGYLPQQQQQQQRLRSPSLPSIRWQRGVRHQEKAANQPGNGNNNNNNNNNNIPLPNGKPNDIDPGNGPGHAHRSNNQNNNPGAAPGIGCQEEDTSGYLSDNTPPKNSNNSNNSNNNTHTPDIWFNDGASQIESISGVGSASVVEEREAGVGRRLRRSIQGGAGANPLVPLGGGKGNAYATKGRRVAGQGYEPLANDGYLADGDGRPRSTHNAIKKQLH